MVTLCRRGCKPSLSTCSLSRIIVPVCPSSFSAISRILSKPSVRVDFPLPVPPDNSNLLLGLDIKAQLLQNQGEFRPIPIADIFDRQIPLKRPLIILRLFLIKTLLFRIIIDILIQPNYRHHTTLSISQHPQRETHNTIDLQRPDQSQADEIVACLAHIDGD